VPPTETPTPTATFTPTATATPTETPFAYVEVVVDNDGPGFSLTPEGDWTRLTPDVYPLPYYGGSMWVATQGQGTNSSQAIFRPTLPVAGYYAVEVWRFSFQDAATNQPFTVYHRDGSEEKEVDMHNAPAEGEWFRLGVYPFDAGDEGYVMTFDAVDGLLVMADAVRWVLVESP